MKKLNLGESLRILANVGVIAGIVFLAVELRQNNQLMEAESRAARNNRLTETPRIVSADVDLADVLVKAGNGETLTESEELRLLSFYVWRHRGQEAYFLEFQAGTVETIPVDMWRTRFHSEMWAAPPPSEMWSEAKPYLGDEFVRWMDENVVNER